MTRYTPLWIQQGNYAASVDRGLVNAIWPTEAVSGMKCSPGGTAMVVNAALGKAAVYINNSASALCYSNALEAVTLAAAHATLDRIDLVVVQVRANDLDGGTNNDWILDKVTGTPAASPVPPAEPLYSAPLAQVLIPAGFNAIIPAGNITDVRPRRLDQPWNTAWGVQAFARVTVATAGITTTEADVQGLTVTADTVANRRYRISASAVPQSTVANDVAHVKITDQANAQLHSQRVVCATAALQYRTHLHFTTAPTAGPSTYKVRAVRDSGTGTISFAPAANNYHEIMIEDIGPVPGSAGTLRDELLERAAEPLPEQFPEQGGER